MKIESTGLSDEPDLGNGERKGEIIVYAPGCVWMIESFPAKGKNRRTGFRDKAKSFIYK